MRLTKIKLAGFKSFVEPTTILFPGRLVGVVGPNGCGKSNIIDAVRWVLGESKAAELRGESIQDVIFKGSGTRKEVGRASVELFFDNSNGRIGGQWGQYGEITVKRVLDREGNSSYYINNLHVRRRDVIDLFLGTGLGPRAYAIIGQGTISRIIEAKPDELRGFLEEAAGVTRYKERRKETEGRLEDARENLARVEDIRGELEGQVTRLEAQAEVARRYRELRERLGRRQNLLWLKKRNEAQEEALRLAHEIDEAETALEADLAALRACEAEVEALREEHFAASDALHAAQAEMFEANAEVRRLEDEIAHRRETRARLGARLAQIEGQAAHWQAEEQRLAEEAVRWQELLAHAERRRAESSERLAEAARRLAEQEAVAKDSETAVSDLRKHVFEAEQRLRLAQTNAGHAQRALAALAQRRARLEAEAAALVAPDPQALAQAEAAEEEAAAALAEAEDQLARLARRQPELEAALAHAREEGRAAHRQAAATRARRDALVELQRRETRGDVNAWRERMGLAGSPQLWQAFEVEAGWEKAFEAVLGLRLRAFGVSEGDFSAFLDAVPPAPVALARLSEESTALGAGDSLFAKVVRCEPRWRMALGEWLADVRVAEDPRQLFSGPGLRVDRAGRMATPHGLVIHAAAAAGEGMLERQREIEALNLACAAHEAAEEAAAAREEEIAGELAALRERLGQARRIVEELRKRLHAAQLDKLKHSEAQRRHDEKSAQLSRDLTELARAEEEEKARLASAEADGEEAACRLEELRARLEEANAGKLRADAALSEARSRERAIAREAQEAAFAEKECRTRLADNARARETAAAERHRLAEEKAAVARELAMVGDEGLNDALQQALALRGERESALAARREALEAAAARLRERDEERLRLEQRLDPGRARLSRLRLDEQAARLAVEQCRERLAEGGIISAEDEAQLAAELTPGLRDAALQAEINRLAKEIEALGPVNLAALEELAAAKRRKEFLDEQAADLGAAIATLEDAIRRIDRETREQLKETFDAVNRHFGALFPELFGGGEARLILTGEEILDAGVQIMAQPPGKRNSTIHLLSGGEKALAAIALVFALFQLNPAPFCMLDEVDAPLDDANTVRYCEMVRRMSRQTQFIFITHSKITMELAEQLIGVTMQEQGVSRIVEVDIENAVRMAEREEAA